MSASISELFSAGDPVARFVVSIAAARNAIEPALIRAGRANDDDDPEFSSHVLVAGAFLHEAGVALRAYRSTFPEVRAFLDKLDKDTRKRLKEAVGVQQQVGPGVLDHSRDSTFHFPHPDPAYQPDDGDARLRAILDALGDEPAEVVVINEEPRRLRLVFADRAMLALAMGAHSDELDTLRAQVTRTRDTAIAFVQLADAVVAAYLDARGATVG